MQKNMVQTSMHGSVSSVIGKERGRGTSKRSVQKREEDWLQMGPSMKQRRSSLRTTITSGIRNRVPVTNKEVVSRKEKRVRREVVKKVTMFRAFGRGIDISYLKILPLEAKSRR